MIKKNNFQLGEKITKAHKRFFLLDENILRRRIMFHLSCIFESTIFAHQSIPTDVKPSTQMKPANLAQFMENAKMSGTFTAANRIYSSNHNAIKYTV